MTASSFLEPQVFSLKSFIEDLRLTASLEADARQCVFIVTEVDPTLALLGDRDLLLSAAGNLLQNAFKFTHRKTEVTLNAYSAGGRILIDVEDSCGGLRPGDTEAIFLPYVQRGSDKSGMGLGLSICQRSVEANGGVLSVRDIPGKGCVFTIDLPRQLESPERAETAASSLSASK